MKIVSGNRELLSFYQMIKQILSSSTTDIRIRIAKKNFTIFANTYIML